MTETWFDRQQREAEEKKHGVKRRLFEGMIVVGGSVVIASVLYHSTYATWSYFNRPPAPVFVDNARQLVLDCQQGAHYCSVDVEAERITLAIRVQRFDSHIFIRGESLEEVRRKAAEKFSYLGNVLK